MSAIKRLVAGGAIALLGGFYVYGPPVTPTMRASAMSSCNDHAGGNYRSYRLDWVVESRPHWSCWDASDPMKPAVDLGWWVNPIR